MCTSWLLTLLLVVTSISCLCFTTILQRCVCTVTRYQAPLASRRSLFAPCLPSTFFPTCVQSPCGSLGFITLTVLNRGEIAVVGHCKFAEMLYSSDELAPRLHPLYPLQLQDSP